MSESEGAPDAGPRLKPGQMFGPYRIERLLGRGGMGEVYEAEHIEQGRRVALKVLNQRLAGPNDRARFLREGQLAASINHPNSVYIFGSEEIAGTPVIAMELLAGGTLKDRVNERGPLPPAEAVDAILQVIAGLDAANAAGILHRDIKPANCFIDRDGTIKVGDFGLSISTMARDVSRLTTTGTFQGTPAFASPEQIRGEPLDVRADLYSVGATLYYLLTGQPPFDDRDLMALVARIATEAARSPRAVRPDVPRDLAAVVVRCLAKDRAQRPAAYAALDEGLRPFSSTAPTPATMGRRVLAGIIDLAVFVVTLVPLGMYVSLSGAVSVEAQSWIATLSLTARVAYYSVLEGYWRASFGKLICRLRVTGRDGQRPGVARAFVRALIFTLASRALPLVLLDQVRFLEPSAEQSRILVSLFRILVSLFWPIAIGLLFLTARRRNGFAGVHELVSGTRVVSRVKEMARPTVEATRAPMRTSGSPERRFGPYDAIGMLGATDVGVLLVGFDPNLRRQVWVHELAPGAPHVGRDIRDLTRPGRLRWLNGRRTATEAWDAYEALDGAPLVSVIDAPRPWRTVRWWLADLAREIDAGLKEGSLSGLAIDHLWVTRDGHAKLLDFRAPGARTAPAPVSSVSLESAQTFLSEVATNALRGRPGEGSSAAAPRPGDPIPVSASAVLATLSRRGFATWSDAVSHTTGLTNRPDRLNRWRRVASLAPCALLPLVMALGVASRSFKQHAIAPEIREMTYALDAVPAPGGSQVVVVGQAHINRAALEAYIAGRFGPRIKDPHTWANAVTAEFLAPHRRLAERIVADPPHVSPDELAAATAALRPFFQEQERRRAFYTLDPWTLALVGSVSLVMLTACFGILWALVFRGGLLFRVFGIAVVTRSGEPASRLRTLWRGALAWGLIVGAPLWLSMQPGVAISAIFLTGIVWLTGVVWAIVRPERGLQDRIAGTWLVPT